MNDLKREGPAGSQIEQAFGPRIEGAMMARLVSEGDSQSEVADEIRSGARTRISVLTVFIALWLGGLCAYLWGYFGADLFHNRDVHLWLAVAAVAFGPIVLVAVGTEIIIQGRALASASQEIARIARRLSEPEGPALKRVALVTNAVRRELDILSGSLDATLDRVAAVEALIENQVSAIERAGGRAQMRAQVIGELLSKERDGLSSIADQMTANAARVADTIQSQASKVTEANREAAQSILQAEASLTRQLEGFQQLTEGHAKNAVATVHEIESVAERLRDLSAASLESARGLSASIETQHETLAQTTQKLDRESQRLTEVFERQGELISRIETSAQNLGERLGAVLTSAGERVNDMFGDLNTRTSAAGETLRAETEAALIAGGNVASAIEQVAAKARTTSASLRETIAAQIDAFNTALSEGLRSLDSAATATGQTLAGARQEADGFSQALDDTVRGIETAGHRLTAVLEGIGERSEATRDTLDDASRALAHHMAEVPDLAADHAARISALLEDQASRMAALANALGGRSGTPQAPQAPATPASSPLFEHAPKSAATTVIPLATAPVSPAEEDEANLYMPQGDEAPVPFAPTPLDQRSGRAAFGRIGQRLRRAARMGSADGGHPAAAFQTQDSEVEPAVREDVEHTVIEEAPAEPPPAAAPVFSAVPPAGAAPHQSPSSGGFWSALFARIEGNDAAETIVPQGATLGEPAAEPEGSARPKQYVLETLYAIAIDLDRLLEEEPPIDLWKRYRAGEADVFARRLLTLRGGGLIHRIRHKYREDIEFREHADRYRARCEGDVDLTGTPAAQLHALLEEALAALQ